MANSIKEQKAEFLTSSTDYRDCPTPNLPEFAFIGRSNVGKSSLINYLTGKKQLARISSKPGKTQLINHFLVNKKYYLVDLPGYGWAKVSKKMKKDWDKMIRDYLIRRENLTNVFVLVDASIPPQKIDLEFINWLGVSMVPLSIVFTKTDKKAKKTINKNISAFQSEMLKNWETLPPVFETSSAKRKGGETLYTYMTEVLESLNN